MHNEQGAVMMIYFNGQHIAFRPVSNEERGLKESEFVRITHSSMNRTVRSHFRSHLTFPGGPHLCQ